MIVKTVAERVAELLATAPPVTTEQREAAVRLLAHPSACQKKGGGGPGRPASAA
ncbi:hypothetical protein JNW88_17070 [Micromonospora sp. ATA32]|nr:hypothetical protein [Micromonospora sp. ATA32]